MKGSKGFTLVELLAALAIAGALAAAALGAVAGLARSGNIARQADSEDCLQARLHSLLRADVIHAQTCRNTAKGFELGGFTALGVETLELAHLPSRVVYEVRPTEAGGLLVRTQELPPEAATSELVCVGVKAIGIAGGGDGAAGPRQIPEVVSIVVEFEGPDRPPMKFICQAGGR